MLDTKDNLKVYGEYKLQLLANGINYDKLFLEEYSRRGKFIEKRRAYGNSDEQMFSKDIKVPQEIILPEGLVVAVNQRNNSKWRLYFENEKFYVGDGIEKLEISFPERPTFYNELLEDGRGISRIVTLYGNATLGIFSPGHCYYWNSGDECKFCSLQPTRNNQADHEMFIKPSIAKEAISIALNKEKNRVKHILINGGTIKDYDLGFKKHIEVLEGIRKLELPDSVQTHLISMPPMDFNLFDRLAKTNSTIAMDIEIFDEKLFDEICPGKSNEYGRDRFINAFKAAVHSLGKGNVYCGFVAGLEPLESLIEGMYFVASLGVVPAVNVFHNDPGSHFANHERPSLDFIREVGKHMSIIYRDNDFTPFIKDTGRNSLDTEAYLGCYL
ncbi:MULTISPECIES: radical SAM protein [Bacillus]|uniref:radical SAM protein n=1 Tax=Bacillus TaxID=1386 RepID=UPI00028CEF3A|nr:MULTISPECIES: radical SAM protein [Bacillus]EKF36477.1 hypothetical protein BA1_05607 [Bacillus xiamenensis]MBD3861249.1 biotin synthase [Bacillus sp. 28A-2]MCW1837943.1 biotin synthase [Bacillus xiamenensis]